MAEERSEKIDDWIFYKEYYGHKIQHLTYAHKVLHELKPNQKFIYFAGDSSLDNKYWFEEKKPACNGYEQFLASTREPHDVPKSKADVAYWVNNFAARQAQNDDQNNYVCLNTAVEESTLGLRAESGLLKHDRFIRDNIRENDVLVVSVGGNDVALRPSMKTIVKMLGILTQSWFTKNTTKKLGTAHFIDLFGKQTKKYIDELVAVKKPKLVIVTMIYFLDENPNARSWAGRTLKMLRYDTQPDMLQGMIRQVYEEGTKKVKIDGCKTVYLPFFEILNGKNTLDYTMRVEPSASGGAKMGRAIVDKIMQEYPR